MSGTPDPIVDPKPEPTLVEQTGSVPETVIPENAQPPADESLTNQEPKADEPESKPEPKPEDKPAGKRPWFQQRIDELTRARREAERQASELKARLAVEEAAKAKPDQPITSLNRDQYERDVRAEAARQLQAQQYESRSRTWLDAGVKEFGLEEFNQRCDMLAAMGASDRPEFMQIILDPDLVPDGHKVVAQLAEHPDDAQRILSIQNPVAMAAALTRFAMTQPAEKKQISNAPKPIGVTVGGTGKPNSMPSDTDDMKTWLAKRRAEVAARKQRA